jgi:hypothetical protein
LFINRKGDDDILLTDIRVKKILKDRSRIKLRKYKNSDNDENANKKENTSSSFKLKGKAETICKLGSGSILTSTSIKDSAPGFKDLPRMTRKTAESFKIDLDDLKLTTGNFKQMQRTDTFKHIEEPQPIGKLNITLRI